MSTYRAVFLGFLVAAIVLLIGDARKGNTAAAVPTHGEFIYSLPAGASSTPLTLPASNSPITINLSTTTGTNRGISTVVLCHTNAAPATLVWTGRVYSTSNTTGGVAVGGSTTSTGTMIIPLDTTGNVILRVSNALNKIEVFNGTGTAVNTVFEWTY